MRSAALRFPPLLPLSMAPLLALLAACNSTPPPPVASAAVLGSYPEAPRGPVTDDYHGVSVADPYRWLEATDSEPTRAWLSAQGSLAETYLATLPAREPIRARLRELWNHPRKSAPRRHGPWWIWRQNDGLQNQSALYCATSANGEGRLLLDPNTLSDDGTTALQATSFSHDGSLLAYGISRSGSDWREWHVLETATGTPRDDHLTWSKFSSAAWAHDNSGFYYVRYPAPPEGSEHEAVTEKPQVCFHTLGESQDQDSVIYERPDQPRWGFSPRVTDDGRYLLIRVSEGTDRRSRWALLDLEDRDAGVRPLLWDFDAAYDVIGSDGTTLYMRTDAQAPRGRVIALDITQPEPDHWREIIAEDTATLDSAQLLGGKLLTLLMRDAHHVMRVHALDGEIEHEIELPTLGSVSELDAPAEDTATFFTFASFTHPPSIYRLDVASGATALVHRPEVPFDPDAFVTRQVFLQSPDGTRVPMFIVYRDGLRLDGTNRTFLYGYGGFNISLTPRFSADRIAWLERGGVYAQPTLRGGGEYGEDWHEAGMLANKQNVFDDFIAAAEYLLRNDYCSRQTLAIGGGSNGGLLVGACLTQRPDLFGAAVPAVGVLDMLRYHHFTIGWAWIPEYGSADVPEQFATLHAYSPLHNVKPGTYYPPTLIMTGDHDDRVVPAHSFKFAAALQHAQAGPAPILLRVETSAGHGAGTPLAKRVEAAADRWAFLEAMLRAPGAGM